MTLEDQGAQDLAESNHGHEDFQSVPDNSSNPCIWSGFPKREDYSSMMAFTEARTGTVG